MSTLDAVVRLVDGALASGLGSGAAISIGDNGREVLRLTCGTAQRVPQVGAPIDDRTLFDVASLTKPMVTTAIAMVLAGERRLDLEAPLRRWIADTTSSATVRAALGHSAGYAAHVDFFRALQTAPPPDPRRELVHRAATYPVQPNTPVYSDVGFIVLAAVLERVADQPLEDVFLQRVAAPLDLTARFATVPVANAVATEVDDRGVVCGLVHDENAYYGGRVCGHAGLFASIEDVARFAAGMVAPRGPFVADIVHRFFTDAPTPGSSWRLGWDTPSHAPGVSHAGDLWPRHGVGHLGFTGTSLWLDVPRKRWVAILTNRVHPSRAGSSADQIKHLRRSIGDIVAAM